jgi:hypothetical protein
MTADSRRKCVKCGSTDFVDGRIMKHQRFIPEGRIFSFGYRMQASVCLDCGTVSSRLNREQLAEIREKSGPSPGGD